jgi:excisionase family DNA binding protein
MSTQNNEQLLTVEDVATKFQVTEKTVYRWAGDKKLPSVKLGPKCLRFDPRAVEDLMNRSRQAQAA